jgi:hypothetical protein
VARQAPGWVSAPGEAKRRLKCADRQESAFLAPATVTDAGPSFLEGFWRTRTRSDDKESIASLKSNISVASRQSRGKKRKMTCSTLDMPVDLVHDLRTATVADINAEIIRQVEIIVKVTITPSNLKGTYIKALKKAASSLAAGTMEFTRRIRTACSTRALVPVKTRPSELEKENEALRKEPAAMAMRAPRAYFRCGVSAYKSGRPPRSGQNDGNEHLTALERKVEELGPSRVDDQPLRHGPDKNR